MPAFEWKANATRDTIQFVTEAVVRRCPVKKVFLEISQNSQENICVRVSFTLPQKKDENRRIERKEKISEIG